MTPAIDIIVRWRDFRPPFRLVCCVLANYLLLPPYPAMNEKAPLVRGALYNQPAPAGAGSGPGRPGCYSGWMPAFLMISPHFCDSLRWKSASSCGEEIAGAVPVDW